jgi:hypothetical protein
MATQEDRRKRGLFIILGIAALLLLAAASLGWLDAWLGGAGGGGTAGAGDVGIADTGGTGAGSGNGCFLGFICLNASARADESETNASADDEGINVNSQQFFCEKETARV